MSSSNKKSSPRSRRRTPPSPTASAPVSTSDALFDELVETLGQPTESRDDRFDRYRDDPVGFVRDVLGGQPWNRQIEVLEALREGRQVTVRSGHGVGKTFAAACTALWFVYTHDPSLVLTTAPTQRQVKEVLWEEIARLVRGARAKLPGRLLEMGLEVSERQRALGLTTNEPERFQGFHCANLLAIVDEASGVPETIFEALHGALTGGNARLLLIGNPTQTSGTFYESHRTGGRGDGATGRRGESGAGGWHKIRIAAGDCPNFQVGVGEALPYPGLVTPEWAAARKAEWGEESPVYQVRVLGEFPSQGSDSLIALAWVEAAEVRGRPEDGATGRAGDGANSACPGAPSEVEMGVDVARFGDCESVVYVRRGPLVVAGEAWRGLDLMETTGRVAALIRRWEPAVVKVDSIGLGAGVVDRLRELGYRQVRGVNVAERARDPERYGSLRDELLFELRQRFRAGEIQLSVGDGRLGAQLTALKYGYSSRGQLQVESKEELRRRGLPSPDRADALALCFAAVREAERPVVAVVKRRAVDVMPLLGGEW